MTRQCWHLTQLTPRASETARQRWVELADREYSFDSRGRVRTVELTKTSDCHDGACRRGRKASVQLKAMLCRARH